MNEAFEKILEKLEELQNNLLSQTEGDVDLQVGVINGVMYSRKIVQEVAEEYNGGWIPCNERLPETSGEYLTWIKYNGKEFHSIDEIDCDGIFKEWNCSSDYKIIAWMNLSAPYQPKVLGSRKE